MHVSIKTVPLLQIEKLHKLWNFDNCQFSIMQLLPSGGYRLISELKADP